MRRKNDALTRARQALSQVDAELDLGRARSDALARARSGPDTHPDTDDAAGSGVEILRHGQRPALPRRHTAVWALVATVALLGGAGLGTALLWQGPSETVPGAPAPASPFPGPDLSTTAPDTGPTDGPRECASTPPSPDSVPTPRGQGQPSSAPLSQQSCGADPSPSPSPSGDPAAGTDGVEP
ncbi:hypothetical protein APR04_001934 [Promicromonospora umidemergens]|uniref:Uncharacterized protein n=1 Tax=Promicromonospora umidemergens TaxID=629679 RepID=A0ABP8XEL2_9MICO|nr:hypothetical protein [Promicromonospora umidemergens]MCP2283031.1 hypothetical protein [Promicromonospora umidemergens]